MTDTELARPRLSARRTTEPFPTRLVFAGAERLLARVGRGSATLELPNGRSRTFGTSGSGHHASLLVHSPRVLWSALARGSCGFAESYMRGEWDSADLAELFRFFCDSREALATGRRLFRVKLPDRLWHRLRANTRAGSRRNISHHYDLGNDFYARWLDPSMTYSSGLYATGSETLEEAQAAKYRLVLDAAAVGSGARVLEIGCGWGGFAEIAAREAGAHVTGLTLSREQLAFAEQRLAAAGLSDHTELRLQDYRDVAGSFAAIVSIEMIEAVGAENWPRYFGTLRDRLEPGGRAVLQAISIAEDRFADYRRGVDFVQRYIFPGGMLPTKAHIEREACAAGLEPVSARHFGADYARTLWAWRERFLAYWPAIAAQGFDERFRRMWEYYLTYCAVGFEKGTIDVGLYVYRRPAA
jgi:cyclopropane-fatty-acyl-phospholipid synthase